MVPWKTTTPKMARFVHSGVCSRSPSDVAKQNIKLEVLNRKGTDFLLIKCHSTCQDMHKSGIAAFGTFLKLN